MGGKPGLLDAGFLWFLLLALGAWFLLQHHKLGNHVHAVGGNPGAAIAIGIRPLRVKLAAIALTGGRGSIPGVVLGTALVFTITDILLLLRAPGFYFDMFGGGLIVLAVIMNHAIRRKS